MSSSHNNASVHHALTKIPSLSNLSFSSFLDNTFEAHSLILGSLLSHFDNHRLSDLLQTRQDSTLEELRRQTDSFQRESNAKAFRKVFYYAAVEELASVTDLSRDLSPIKLAKHQQSFINVVSDVLKKRGLLSNYQVKPKKDNRILLTQNSDQPSMSSKKSIPLKNSKKRSQNPSSSLLSSYKTKNKQLTDSLVLKSTMINTATVHLTSVLGNPDDVNSLSKSSRERLTAALSSLNTPVSFEEQTNENEVIYETPSFKPFEAVPEPSIYKTNTFKKPKQMLEKNTNTSDINHIPQKERGNYLLKCKSLSNK
ncbi:hypothetical protein GEMRC1_012808 [Eukaryota sp. GEM-RC1]